MVKKVKVERTKYQKDDPFVEGVRFWRNLWEGEYDGQI